LEVVLATVGGGRVLFCLHMIEVIKAIVRSILRERVDSLLEWGR